MEGITVVVLIGVSIYFFFKHIVKRNADAALAGERDVHSTASARDWVQPFVLYCVASEMQFVFGSVLPDKVRELATGRVTGTTQQSLLASLQMYLSFSYGRNRQADDLPVVTEEARRFLQAELQTLNTPLALRQFIRDLHEEETQAEISAEELEAQCAAIIAKIKADDEYGFSIRNMMLKNSVEQLFASKHGTTIAAYNASLVAHSASLT